MNELETLVTLKYGIIPTDDTYRMMFIRTLPKEFQFQFGYLYDIQNGIETVVTESTYRFVFSTSYQIRQELIEYESKRIR